MEIPILSNASTRTELIEETDVCGSIGLTFAYGKKSRSQDRSSKNVVVCKGVLFH
jgi:hypothetical protein